ncbi:hypothetical protein NE237_029222 [Protea cynaroides]|uniref:CCHC-type domain-containing protein n=1 Tax=Protea cynaroides TaxID=273540 RepID=A0A9Q0GTW7_9MAGN|nr:hypothetical protein NE237_029222 [Protea cynaroides]
MEYEQPLKCSSCGKYGHSAEFCPEAKHQSVQEDERNGPIEGDTLVQQVPHVQGAWANVSDGEESTAADDEVQPEKDGDVRSRMSELDLNLVAAQANGEMNDIPTSVAGTESVDVAPILGASTVHDENARWSDTSSASRATLSRVDRQVWCTMIFIWWMKLLQVRVGVSLR